jgi:hypothetical protein
MGALAAPWHFPLPELLLTRRPDASRRVPLKDPEGLTLVVVWLPVSRPDASRYCVRLPLPEKLFEVALPVVRPLASL